MRLTPEKAVLTVFPEACAEGKETPPVVSGRIPRFVLGLNAMLLIFASCCGVKLKLDCVSNCGDALADPCTKTYLI